MCDQVTTEIFRNLTRCLSADSVYSHDAIHHTKMSSIHRRKEELIPPRQQIRPEEEILRVERMMVKKKKKVLYCTRLFISPLLYSACFLLFESSRLSHDSTLMTFFACCYISCLICAGDISLARTSMQKFRENVSSASAELFGSKGGETTERKESAVVKKLKQPKVKKPTNKAAADGSKDGVGKEEEGEDEEEEEENKGGVGSLMIVKSAGEAWKRLQERLKEAPIIQVRPFFRTVLAWEPVAS